MCIDCRKDNHHPDCPGFECAWYGCEEYREANNLPEWNDNNEHNPNK